jgi:hypothetical protein
MYAVKAGTLALLVKGEARAPELYRRRVGLA